MAAHDDPTSIQMLDTPSQALSTALHVITTERDALTHLEILYRTNELAQKNISRAVSELAQTIKRGGKLVISGVGKSGKIGRKLEATMNSVGIHSVFLHPTEALHGDLGVIRSLDTLLLISFSGRTAELLLMLQHIPPTVPVLAITSHTHPSSCPLLSFNSPDMTILLPAPLHIDEESSFGLSAPTSSTTVALALGDALALAAAQNLHTSPGQGPAEVFKRHHPGGAIGAATAAASAISTPATSITISPSLSSVGDACMELSLDDNNNNNNTTSINTSKVESISTSEFFVPIECIPLVPPHRKLHPSPEEQKEEEEREPIIRILDILLSAIQNPTSKSWVKLSSTTIIPPHLLRALTHTHTGQSSSSSTTTATTKTATTTTRYNIETPISKIQLPHSIHAPDWLRIRASSTLDDAKHLINESAMTVFTSMSDNSSATTNNNTSFEDYKNNAVICVVDDVDAGKVLGFVSGEDVCSS